MILLYFVLITSGLVPLVFWEFKLDAQILKHPEKFHPLFIRFKHWVYNTPRLLLWFIRSITFLNHYSFREAVGITAITVTANAFFFRFLHDWLYQWLILTHYKKGTYNGFLNSFLVAFNRDSETPVKEENSFWDKHLRDTSANRLHCFQIFTVITIIQIIFKLY